MRRFIRHPTDIPITVQASSGSRANAVNLSVGGLCCFSERYLEPGTRIDIGITAVKPEYEGHGIVCWCKRCSERRFELGVSFDSADEAFRTRMVEQVCQIEHYRRQMLEKHGRRISGEVAAQEWIERYAANFDQPDE